MVKSCNYNRQIVIQKLLIVLQGNQAN